MISCTIDAPMPKPPAADQSQASLRNLSSSLEKMGAQTAALPLVAKVYAPMKSSRASHLSTSVVGPSSMAQTLSMSLESTFFIDGWRCSAAEAPAVMVRPRLAEATTRHLAHVLLGVLPLLRALLRRRRGRRW